MEIPDDPFASNCPHLFDGTPRDLLERWAKNLSLFRFCKGSRWGHGNEQDSFRLKIGFNTEADAIEVLRAIGVSVSPRVEAINENYPLASFVVGNQKYLSKFSGCGNQFWGTHFFGGYFVTVKICVPRELLLEVDAYWDREEDFEYAKNLEPILMPYKERVIDPPQSNYCCVCPMNYPEFWQ